MEKANKPCFEKHMWKVGSMTEKIVGDKWREMGIYIL